MKDLAPTNASILLLDSDSVMRSALRDALENAGYLVVTAGGLGGAVDRVGEMQPDLLITRPYINSMPGRTAADFLRTKCPGLPILIIAGLMDDDRVNVENATEEFHTFPKPFSRDELLAKVKEVLDTVHKAGPQLEPSP